MNTLFITWTGGLLPHSSVKTKELDSGPPRDIRLQDKS